MTAIAETGRKHGSLLIAGSELYSLAEVAVLLQPDFAVVSVVHTSQPLARAASQDADLTVVFLEDDGEQDELGGAVEACRALIALAGDVSRRFVKELETAGAIVLPASQLAVLQAIVAGLAAQVG